MHVSVGIGPLPKLLATVSKDAVSVGVEGCVWVLSLDSFKYLPGSGPVGSCGNSVFNFLRNSKGFLLMMPGFKELVGWYFIPFCC